MLELNFEQEGDQVALMLSIPVIRAKDEDEIEAAEAKSNLDEEDEQDDTLEDEEASEEVVSEVALKPKKRRSKKVTAPEELENGTREECSDENSSEIEISEENTSETETVCETSEG